MVARTSRLLALALAGSLLSACEYVPGTNDHRKAEAKRQIARLLRDPSSAQFRDVRVLPAPKFDETEKAAGPVVCGEVNGKNGMGGYAGFARFIARPDAPDEHSNFVDPQREMEAEGADEKIARCERDLKGPFYSQASIDLVKMQCEEAQDARLAKAEQAEFERLHAALCERPNGK